MANSFNTIDYLNTKNDLCKIRDTTALRRIRWDDEQRAITLDDMMITLTRAQYRLFSPLRCGIPISYADLAMEAYGYEVDEKVRVMMDKHIDRIRGKLRGTGIYIYCVLGYGYLLLGRAPLTGGRA